MKWASNTGQSCLVLVIYGALKTIAITGASPKNLVPPTSHPQRDSNPCRHLERVDGHSPESERKS